MGDETIDAVIRVVIYVRISKDKIGAGLGVAEQLRQCQELAKRMGYQVVAVFSDNDLSAYTGKARPDYLRMLTAIKAGHVDKVIAWHTDRLHRSNAELEDYITAVEPHDVTTETVKAGVLDLSTPTGRMVARQLCAIARYESEHRAERVSSARERQAMQGIYGGGNRPYGFEPDGITVRPEEAEVVVAMAYKFLSGVTTKAIASDLRTQGILTATGVQWSPTGVRTVLLRPRNAGLMVHRATQPRGKQRPLYSEADIAGPAPWAPLIPEDVWRAVVEKLADPHRRTTPGPAPAWLGSGIYRCPCGNVLRGSKGKPGSSKPRDRYICTLPGKGHVAMPAEDLDRLVKDVTFERLSRMEAAKLIGKTSGGPSLPELRAQLKVHRLRLDELASDYDDDKITKSQRDTGTAKRRKKIAAIEAQLDAQTGMSPLTPLILADNLETAWKEIGLGGQRNAIKALFTITLKAAGRGHRNVKPTDRVIFAKPVHTGPSTDEAPEAGTAAA